MQGVEEKKMKWKKKKRINSGGKNYLKWLYEISFSHSEHCDVTSLSRCRNAGSSVQTKTFFSLKCNELNIAYSSFKTTVKEKTLGPAGCPQCSLRCYGLDSLKMGVLMENWCCHFL